MPFLLLLPVVAVLGGMVLLGEELTLPVATGGAIVIAGVAINIYAKLHTGAPEYREA